MLKLRKYLPAKSLYLEVLKLEQATVGDTVASRHYDKGIEGEEIEGEGEEIAEEAGAEE